MKEFKLIDENTALIDGETYVKQQSEIFVPECIRFKFNGIGYKLVSPDGKNMLWYYGGCYIVSRHNKDNLYQSKIRYQETTFGEFEEGEFFFVGGIDSESSRENSHNYYMKYKTFCLSWEKFNDIWIPYPIVINQDKTVHRLVFE